jgi:hypothetical protein
VGTKYAWTSTAPGFGPSDVNAAFVALLADPRDWGWVHLVGTAASIAAAMVMAAVLDTQMTAASAKYKYGFAILELPTDDDANIITGTAGFASVRVSPVADYAELTSVLTGRTMKRHAAWPYAARLGRIAVQRHPGCFEDGPLPGVGALYRDENATPGLHEARITTLRKFDGEEAGRYVTGGRMFAPAGSDFADVQFRRVMDKACRLNRARVLRWLNRDLKVDRVTGFLTKDEIAAIETDVTQYLRAGLKAGDSEGAEVSDVEYVVTPDNPILTNKTIYGKLRVLSKAYAEWIDTELGFTNPALALA